MSKTFYIGYYDNGNDRRRYGAVPAATAKMSYIFNALHKSGHNIEVVSFCDAKCACCGTNKEIEHGITLRFFASLGACCKVVRVLSRWLISLQAFFFLLFNASSKDTVMVYHSLGYMRIIRMIKKLKHPRLIFEIEEIYSDVSHDTAGREEELKFFAIADAYFFATELLDEFVNKQKRPSVIIYGTYKVEEARENCGFEDKTSKHILYAGTFDLRKGGGMSAALSAQFLPENYHLHIIGFGPEKDKAILTAKVEELQNKTSAKVTMDGLFWGEDYIRFIQGCDVGLSTQIPGGIYNDTSFPSKVLSYLANGLRVVSVNIPVLKRSKISDLIYYYEGDSPQSIAETVEKIDFDAPYESRKIIEELDRQFIKDADAMLRGK